MRYVALFLMSCSLVFSVEEKPWTVNAFASFLYWSVSQENMELGVVNDKSDANVFVNGNIVNSDFSYFPGFILGCGWTIPESHWDGAVQYTWYRSRNTTSTTLQPGGLVVLTPFWEVPDPIATTFYNGQETWKVAFDFIDAITSRSSYLGKGMSFRPFFGARAAWIRQTLNVQYIRGYRTSPAHQNLYVRQGIHSWGIGPRAGLDMKWNVGYGLRLYGNGGGDLLYTQYTKLFRENYSTTVSGAQIPGTLFLVKQKDLHHIRLHVDFELGVGWQMAFGSSGKMLDLSVGYTFQIFFHQNLFRQYINDQILASMSPTGDLDAQGATISAKFAF